MIWTLRYRRNWLGGESEGIPGHEQRQEASLLVGRVSVGTEVVWEKSHRGENCLLLTGVKGVALRVPAPLPASLRARGWTLPALSLCPPPSVARLKSC